ncbi:hypothetical protein SBOR_5507 [Sclerotinia borealis F-4128]|uniref:Mtf2-like C-terminal domain-containing protein n=1 Tax=Sclerotinia borealis (strain F-4128) TaxID=1432307 RepID=W9CBF3_SCLBF|nr:hypothetical protein SBOR_5507 [Sclerotinia borealis F-4128]
MASIKALEAIPIAYSNISSTMMPFLYQTRTIAGLHRSICNRRYQNSILPSIRRTNFHTSLPRASYEKQDGNYSAQEEDTGLRIKRMTFAPRNNHSNRPQYPKSELESEGNIAQPGIIGFEEDDKTLVEYGKEIEALISPQYPRRESTITDSERHTFNRIFTDIFSRTQRTSLNDLDYGRMQNRPSTNRDSARNKLDDIMGSSLTNLPPRTKEQRQAEINKYPPALRAAAARAIGLQPEDELEIEIETSELGADAQEELRAPERERVEKLLRNAETDFELWEVLEEEVFPLIAKMGLGETKESRDQLRRGVLDHEIPPIEEDPPTATDIKPEISPLALYGPLYPSHLLLGLRLLDRGFSRPSQLTLTMLPRIKSFGLLSHVLGASTPLYNELLRICWSRYDDFRTCIDLLKEMDHAGLEFDSETLGIVTDILKVRALVWTGGAGRNKAMLWALPEFRKSRLLEHWQEKIATVIGEKRMKERV